jgi:hypothetical protein
MSHIPPTPPKGTPALRYAVGYCSYGSMCLSWFAADDRAYALDCVRAYRAQGYPAYAVAITSTGKRVRIGGGVK